MSWDTWAALFAASWLISLSPGPGAVFAMSCGVHYGFKRGYLGTLGLFAGIVTGLIVVAAGLGAVLASSATAFLVIKMVGASYLIWLGIKAWRSADTPPIRQEGSIAPFQPMSVLSKGWAVNATNPKGILFLLAVVPQFLELDRPLGPQYLIVALTLGFTDAVVMGGYTLLAARLSDWFHAPKIMRRINHFFGGLFVLAGLALLYTEKSD